MLKPITVLSLFDGISCGRVALERVGIPVEKYYASEIDKYAIKISQKNYSNTIQLGNIIKWEEWDIDWLSIDLILAGSPCQGFSFAGKQLNFNDPRSKLFFEFVEILDYVKKLNPNVYFLLENVKMKKEYLDVITQTLGVEPILINSALVSAQNRQRCYWTNIPGVTQPEDKGLLLKDIIDLNFKGEEKYLRDKSKIIRIGGRNSPPESKQNWDNIFCTGAARRNQQTKNGTLPFLNIRKDKKSNVVVSSYVYNLNGCIINNNYYGICKPIYGRYRQI